MLSCRLYSALSLCWHLVIIPSLSLLQSLQIVKVWLNKLSFVSPKCMATQITICYCPAVPLVHVLSLHSKVLVSSSPYPDMWSHITGANLQDDTTRYAVLFTISLVISLGEVICACFYIFLCKLHMFLSFFLFCLHLQFQCVSVFVSSLYICCCAVYICLFKFIAYLH